MQKTSFSLLLLLLLFLVLLLLIVFPLLSFFSLLFRLLLLLLAVAAIVGLSVDGLADLERRVLEALKSIIDLVGVLRHDSLVEGRDITLHLVLDILGDTRRVLLELLLGVVDELVSLILKINHALELLISLLGALGLLDHSVDVGVGKTATGANGDLLLLTCGLVLCRNVHDTVGIDVESDLNLWHTARSHGDALKIEITELLVVLGELTLTLENSDADLGLVIGGGGEDLALLGGNGRVSRNQSGEDSAHGFDTKGQGSDVEEKDILDIAGEDGTLDGSANRDSLIRVHTSVGLLAEEVLDGLTNLGDTAGAANHENLIDVSLGQGRILEAGFEWLKGAVDERFDETLELCTCHLVVQVLRSAVIEGEVRDANRSVGGRGELNLSFLSSLTHTLKGTLVLHDIDTALVLELASQEVLKFKIKIFTAEGSVSVSGLNLENTTGDLED